MTKRTICLAGAQALSALQAQTIARAAMRFSARVLIKDQRGVFNGKSMLGLLSLGRFVGEELTLITEGEDEVKAADTLQALLQQAITPS